MKFLARLAENSELNKMTAANLAIVFAPSLLWPAPAVDDDTQNLLNNSGSVGTVLSCVCLSVCLSVTTC